MAKRKEENQKQAQLPATTAQLMREQGLVLTLEEIQEFHDWLRAPLEFKWYRDLRKHLERVAKYHLMGLLEQKQLNAQTYVASALLITMDRERQFESEPGDDLKQVLEAVGGEVKLTHEQAAQFLQTASDAARVKLLKRFVNENQGIVDAEEVITDGVPTELKDVIEKTEEREEWAF